MSIKLKNVYVALIRISIENSILVFKLSRNVKLFPQIVWQFGKIITNSMFPFGLANFEASPISG